MLEPLSLLGLTQDPDSPFVLTSAGAFSRDRLSRRAAAVAAALEEAGAAGERTVVSLDSGVAFVSGLAGCWLAGSTPVLLDPLVRQELFRSVEMTGARAVIRGSAGARALPDGVVELVPGEGERDPGPPPSFGPDDPVLYLFTSGSTGQPSLVPKSFGQLDVEVRFLSDLLGRPGRVATLVPWCHIFGLLTSLMVPARLGGVCDLTAGISPLRVLERAAGGLVDLVVAVPAVYQVMVRYLEAGELGPIPETCVFTSSGAPLTAALRERFAELSGGRSIIDLYGSTEAGGVAYRVEDGPWIVEPHVETRITGDGFLEVRSGSVSFPGEDGFYRIGDLVRAAPGGFHLDGRADDVVKIGGRRTSLKEVEAAVEACSGVVQAVVRARSIRGAVRLVAAVEIAEEGVTAARIKAFVRGRLADHKVPREVVVVGRLPRTPAGKIDRRHLDAMLEGSE